MKSLIGWSTYVTVPSMTGKITVSYAASATFIVVFGA
jgi:hypothetical protein